MLLVTPPPTPSVTPFAAIAYLSGSLGRAGIPNYKVDLGLALTCWLLETDRLSLCRRTGPVSVEMRAGMGVPLGAAEVIAGAAEAAGVLRSPYRDLEAHERAARVVRAAFGLLSDAAPAGKLTLGTYDHPWGNAPLMEIVDRLLGPDDILAEFLHQSAQRIAAAGYPLIAVSVAHADQQLPALSLAKALREAGFEGVIALGGVQISFLANQLLRTPAFFTHVDCALPKMGEETIVALAEATTRGDAPSVVPGAILMDADGASAVRQVPGYREPALRDLPLPDFSGLPLDKYLSAHPILPLRTATKCYWGHCKFCRITGDHQFATKGLMTGRVLFDTITAMMDRHGCRDFVFADDATSPRSLTDFSRRVIENGLDVRWVCIGLRPEDSIRDSDVAQWRRAGCASVAIGFESGSQRMIDIMQKGQRVETVERLLRTFDTNEIITFCYGFYGHPLETEEDLRQSLEFRRRNESYASYFAAGRWLLSPYNLDFREIDALGISVEMPKNFAWGRDYWLKWTSPRRAEHERTIVRLLHEYGGANGPRNYLSDWIYWGQGMHIPFEWVRAASRGAI